MAQTEKGIVYPYDYNEVADVPADFKALAESIDALLNDYSLNTDSGNKIVLEMNSTTYKIKAVLKDKDDNVINTSNEIDLPLENMVTNISYNNQTLTLTHQDGQTTEVSIADLISDLASKEEVTELQSQVEDLTTLVETELDTNEVEGTTLDVSDSAEYRGRIEVKGNTYQKQLSGKNLFNHFLYPSSTTFKGVTLTNNGDGSFTLNGTCTENNTSFKLGDNEYIKNLLNEGDVTQTAYYISGNCSKVGSSSARTVIRFNYDTGTDKMIPLEELSTQRIISKINPRTSRETSWSWRIVLNAGDTFNNFTIKYQVEKGTVGTDWEPYCGEQAAPNPSYEIPIKVVTGDNVVKHFGMNLFDFIANLNTEIAGLSISSDKAGNIIVNGTPTRSWVTIVQKVNITDFLEDGQTYTLWQENIESNGGHPWIYAQIGYGENTASNYYSITTASNMLKFTVDKSKNNIYQIMVQTGNNLVNYNNVKNRFMLLKGDYTNKEVVYEPYIEEESQLDLWKENEFDKENVLSGYNINKTTSKIANVSSSTLVYMSCKPNTTYKISKILSSRFGVGTTREIPAANSTVYNYIRKDGNTEIIIKTGTQDTYIVAWVHTTTYDTEITVQEILDSIQIQEAIELCKINNDQDILFKNVVGDENYNAELEEGAWYKKSAIAEVVLDGRETWNYNSGNRYFFTNKFLDNYVTQYTKLVSNNYIGGMASNGGLYNNHIQTGTAYSFMICDNRFTDKNDLKTWLSTHNTIVKYPLATPIYEKITDPNLISQLEALKKAKWFKGVNHWWTETENLEPVLKGTYKQSNNIKNKERDERLDNLESRLALLE